MFIPVSQGGTANDTFLGTSSPKPQRNPNPTLRTDEPKPPVRKRNPPLKSEKQDLNSKIRTRKNCENEKARQNPRTGCYYYDDDEYDDDHDGYYATATTGNVSRPGTNHRNAQQCKSTSSLRKWECICSKSCAVSGTDIGIYTYGRNANRFACFCLLLSWHGCTLYSSYLDHDTLFRG